MSDVELVIKIPEGIYNYIHNEHIAMRVCDSLKVAQAIENGTPLPKGHGRLIDADAEIKKIQDISDRVKKRVKNRNAPCFDVDVYDSEIAAMRLASTIIEADKAESEE